MLGLLDGFHGAAGSAITDALPPQLADALPTVASGASQVVGSPQTLGMGGGAPAVVPARIPTPQDMMCGDPGWAATMGDLGAGPLIAAIPGLSLAAPEQPRRDQW